MNDNRKLVNVGGWYRNPVTINLLEVPYVKEKYTGKSLWKLFCCCKKEEKPEEYYDFKDKGYKFYKLKKASLKGKSMESYFPPEGMMVYGQFSHSEKKGFIRIHYDTMVPFDYVNMSHDPNPKNKWVYYFEKFVNGNNLLVDEFDLDFMDIPKEFSFELDENLEDNQVYEKALQEYMNQIINSVEVIDYLSDEEYDKLISKNIVFLHLVDCSGCNTLIESIVRNTPVVVNRHPAIVEYLGEGYPLYFDHRDQIYDLMDMDLIEEAHNYLKSRNNDYLSITKFIDSLKKSGLYKNLNI